MRILVIGGTGPIGGHAALYLAGKRHDVVISSRNPPAAGTGLEELPWLQGDYLKHTFTEADLGGFDAVVFAAGVDVRHVPPGEDADAFYLHANGEIVPAFAAMAKRAGVSTFIHIGSFYPQVVPEKVEEHPYVRSRMLADKGICALADSTFRAMSLNAPFVVGLPKGMKNEMFSAYVGYARGLYPNIKPFGPAGATNFISVQSLSEAIEGALARGVGGTSYLLGDENLSFADYFGLIFKAVGNTVNVPELDEEHPMLPDFAIIQGRGNVIAYEPDAAETELLGYRRGDIARTMSEIVASLDAQVGEVEPVALGPEAAPLPELRRLADLYARAMDTKDASLLEAIMAADAILVGPGFRIEGLEAIRAIPATLGQYYRKTQHVVTQQLAQLEGDRAVGETYCTAHHILFPDPTLGDQVLTWHIRYQDRFAKVGGAWRFARRDLIVDWMEVRTISLPLGPEG